jgi:5,10-methylenetetrahydromethanopterin reductase
MRWGMPWPGRDVARSAEEAGASAFCAGEFADSNAYMTAIEMARATSTAMIGTGIAYAFARAPLVHAAAARQLHRIAPGRTFLGLGTATPRMNREWFGVDATHPARRVGELIEVIREFLRAENDQTIRYRGAFYTIDARVRAPVLGAIDVPILLGAVNARMLHTAGRHADGVLGHGIFTDRWWDEIADPHIAQGAARAGRDPERLLRWGWVIAAVDDSDPRRAIADARRQIAFYLTVKTYDPLIDLHGWHDEVSAIRTEFSHGDPRAIGEHVSDEMLHAMAVCGDSAQARQMLAARRRLPDTGFVSAPGFLVSQRRRTRYAAESVALMGAASGPPTIG